MSRALLIAPSILSADFARLGQQVADAEASGADMIHVDVMDGHFVPNMTIGPLIVQAVRKTTSLPLDVHLMIERPERLLPAFRDAGADILTVHVETCPHLHRTVQQIQDMGAKAGVALNPATPLHMLEEIVPLLDLVLIMTVNPGYGGQRFIESSLSKIERLRAMLDACGSTADLEVDGGITPETAPQVVGAGANALVAGSAIFGSGGRDREAIRQAIGQIWAAV